MLPDRVSNPGPLTYESGALPIALRGPAKYCSELYNYESCGDNTVLDCSQPPEEDLQPILREEVEIAVASLKTGKSAGVDNIPAELVQAGGETMIDVLTEICNRIWRTGEWPTPWTQSLIITLPKKGNLQLCQNYRTISFISHSSKVMLKVISNRLKPQAEEIIAEEQAGLRAGRSTTEQIFNLRILCEKYLQHQQNLYHVFTDFKKKTVELEKRTQAFEMRCYRRLLNISYKDHVTNEEVHRKIQAAIGEYDELLTLVKKRKLRWFGHVSRSSGLAKTILQGTVKGKRKRGRQKKRWEDNIKEWTGMDFASSTRAGENRSRWKGIVANSSVVPRRPSKVMG